MASNGAEMSGSRIRNNYHTIIKVDHDPDRTDYPKRKNIGRLISSVKSKFPSFITFIKIIIHFIFHCWSGRRTEDDDEVRLCEAARRGDWKTAEEIEKKHPAGILSNVISKNRNETALHIATRFKKAAFVEKLVEEKLSKEDLEARNIYGNTALCIAATSGAVDIAELMVRKHKDLVFSRGSGNATPILIATRYKQKIMVDYLHTAMDSILLQNNMQSDDQTMKLLLSLISADYYDIACTILNRNEYKLALVRDINNEETLLHIMARKSNTIASYKKTTKWQSYIDKSWFKCIFEKTRMQIKAHEMVAKMWSTVTKSCTDQINYSSNMLHEAVRVGNVEFLEVLLRANPELLQKVDNNGKSIFHVAVENRQESVFCLINEMNLLNLDDLLHYFDEEKCSLLDLAAKRPHSTHLHRLSSGAVFQMHRELLWFKEVENMVEFTRSQSRGQTLRELFSEEHKDLKEEGEKWVKKTANSCMLVATLIATVVFAAAFTVPGGKNETETAGTPIFLNKNWFTVFVVSDGIGMMSSSTSILLFLSILTSRCAENDFLFWLPLELVFGIGFLFVSVLSMVMAFAATFFLYYHKDTASALPWLIISMPVVPISWFCILQWKLWAHALLSLQSTLSSFWLQKRIKSVLQKVTTSVFLH